MSRKYLVTGLAGTGKTTLETLFNERNYETNDLDQVFTHWYDRKTWAIIERDPNGGRNWLDRYTFRLDLTALKKRLNQKLTVPLIMFGDTGDLLDHCNLFDRVFLLEYPSTELIRYRLLNRAGNAFGKHPDELAEVIGCYERFQENFRLKGALPIDCSQSLEKIVKLIEKSIIED